MGEEVIQPNGGPSPAGGSPALVSRKQPLHGCTRCAVAHRRGRWAIPAGDAAKAAKRAAAKAAAGDEA